MPSFSLWPWALALPVLLLVFLAVQLVKRFRATCRGVREELTALVMERYPGTTVLGEERGNLRVRLPNGEERLWEMADHYSAVLALPTEVRYGKAREPIYQRALDALFPLTQDQPLLPKAHTHRIMPRLHRSDTPASGVSVPQPELGLDVEFLIPTSGGERLVTLGDLPSLEMEASELLPLALRNLGRAFPAEMVTAQSNGGTAIQLGDGLDGTRLLLVPQLLPPGEERLALVPHRDLMVLLSPAELTDLPPEKLREGWEALRCDGHTPLLDQPVRVSRYGFTLVSLAPADPPRSR